MSKYHVLRGGSWLNSHRLAASASRFDDLPGSRPPNYGGFRVIEETPPPDDTIRILRGGSWNDLDFNAAAPVRYFNHPDGRNFDVGFRVIEETPPLDGARRGLRGGSWNGNGYYADSGEGDG